MLLGRILRNLLDQRPEVHRARRGAADRARSRDDGPVRASSTVDRHRHRHPAPSTRTGSSRSSTRCRGPLQRGGAGTGLGLPYARGSPNCSAAPSPLTSEPGHGTTCDACGSRVAAGRRRPGAGPRRRAAWSTTTRRSATAAARARRRAPTGVTEVADGAGGAARPADAAARPGAARPATCPRPTVPRCWATCAATRAARRPGRRRHRRRELDRADARRALGQPRSCSTRTELSAERSLPRRRGSGQAPARSARSAGDTPTTTGRASDVEPAMVLVVDDNPASRYICQQLAAPPRLPGHRGGHRRRGARHAGPRGPVSTWSCSTSGCPT